MMLLKTSIVAVALAPVAFAASRQSNPDGGRARPLAASRRQARNAGFGLGQIIVDDFKRRFPQLDVKLTNAILQYEAADIKATCEMNHHHIWKQQRDDQHAKRLSDFERLSRRIKSAEECAKKKGKSINYDVMNAMADRTLENWEMRRERMLAGQTTEELLKHILSEAEEAIDLTEDQNRTLSSERTYFDFNRGYVLYEILGQQYGESVIFNRTAGFWSTLLKKEEKEEEEEDDYKPSDRKDFGKGFAHVFNVWETEQNRLNKYYTRHALQLKVQDLEEDFDVKFEDGAKVGTIRHGGSKAQIGTLKKFRNIENRWEVEFEDKSVKKIREDRTCMRVLSNVEAKYIEEFQALDKMLRKKHEEQKAVIQNYLKEYKYKPKHNSKCAGFWGGARLADLWKAYANDGQDAIDKRIKELEEHENNMRLMRISFSEGVKELMTADNVPSKPVSKSQANEPAVERRRLMDAERIRRHERLRNLN